MQFNIVKTYQEVYIILLIHLWYFF